jgi:putative FmdB family regulatory protein
MPIYEYLCIPCNRVFNFLSPTVNPSHLPTCPKCGSRNLKKMLSRFAFVGRTRKASGEKAGAEPAAAAVGAGAPSGADAPTPFDDPRVEQEMERLMQDAEGIDEDDPRQIGRLMRRLTELTGEKLDPEMATALRRLEAGEDPEKIEADMGDLLGEDGVGGPGAPPSHDDGLYSF